MTTPTPKPVKTKLLNPKLLPIAAGVLILLALLFMVTPLVRPNRGFQRNGNFVTQGSGNLPAQGNNGTTQTQGGPGSRFFGGGAGSSTGTPRRLAIGGGLFAGVIGPIIYFIMLLASLAAAIGMFLVKRWGQVFGLVMGSLYGLFSLISLLGLVLVTVFGFGNPFSLILGIVHLLLAVAVIVLAAIPGKPAPAPASA